MCQQNRVIEFSDIKVEITDSDSLQSDISNYFSVKKLTEKLSEYENIDSVMHFKSEKSKVSILFSKQIPMSDIWCNNSLATELKDNQLKDNKINANIDTIEEQCLGNSNNKILIANNRIIKPSTSSTHDIPFYLSVTNIKNIKNDTDFLEFFINLYDINDNKIGELRVSQNCNILIRKAVIQSIIGDNKNIEDISYLKLSMNVSGKCQFNLNYFTFSFVDNMSDYIYYSNDFNVNIRLQVNNIQKKENGVVVFFPSFYVQEKIDNLGNYIKWPNYTRHSWNVDLDKYCTIYVADPFQYVNGNDKSSWFVAPNGLSILPEIAKNIRNILGVDKISDDVRQSIFSISSLFDGKSKSDCGPIINYGSSMGGFAAFLFSCYLEPTLCFIECPQANILNYKYSIDYLEKRTSLKTRFKKVKIAIGKLLEKDREKKKRYYFSKIANSNDLSFSAILRNHNPKFRTLIHYYSLDKQHQLSFNNEILLLSDSERKSFNYQLVIENDIENQLFTHQAMPKDKVLEIFKTYLSKKR